MYELSRKSSRIQYTEIFDIERTNEFYKYQYSNMQQFHLKLRTETLRN